jgi:hypothetical protein
MLTVHCEMTSNWIEDGKFRIYLNNGFGRSPETRTGVILREGGFRTCPLLDTARGYALHIWRPIFMCRSSNAKILSDSLRVESDNTVEGHIGKCVTINKSQCHVKS